MRDFLRHDRPTLTCMIQAESRKRVFDLIRLGNEGGTDAFGLQLERLPAEDRTPDMLRDYFAAMGKPVYITNYRHAANEGKSEDELAEGLLTAADCGAALLDVPGDFFAPNADQLTFDPAALGKQKSLIDGIHARGAGVLISSHTFRFMDRETVTSFLRAQADRGADVCKIVTDAADEKELAADFETSAALASFDRPALFLCGGAACRRHRLFAPLMTASLYLCVAEHDALATPSQPLLSTAKALIGQAFGSDEV